ncbi:DUF2634 domain-containing protein [Paenibacillus sp. SC116]|uniref:DUF2634 domain-containing protein n=1 Tax=Paenibacillus sp. SC116 TaxID=2968986 RepID=UPI00215B1516|nr:DUF2634 domain-containing protein [Paenibacillus sp. SC116]MCR8844051.1 DUF2634 domain-containing protein [Paenibacillus sp. SC116]
MSLLPEQVETAIPIMDIELELPEEQTSRTYRLDVQKGRITGFVDEIEAVKQAVFKVLQTERFVYLIYSWNYGIELNVVMGENEAVVRSELKRIVTEALLADERITDVTDFLIHMVDRRTAAVEFTVVSIFGQVRIEEEVTI